MAGGNGCGCAQKCAECTCQRSEIKKPEPGAYAKWFYPKFPLPLLGITAENRHYWSGLLHARMIALEKHFNNGTSIENEKLLAQYEDANPGFGAKTLKEVVPAGFETCDISAWKRFIKRYFEAYPEGNAPASGRSAKSVITLFRKYCNIENEIKAMLSSGERVRADSRIAYAKIRAVDSRQTHEERLELKGTTMNTLRRELLDVEYYRKLVQDNEFFCAMFKPGLEELRDMRSGLEARLEKIDLAL
jgi:hypothetical protein